MQLATTRWRSVSGAMLAMIGLAVMSFALMTLRTEGADHKDSPSVEADGAADITDVYAFRSATDPNSLVVALDVNPLTAPAANATTTFANDVDYRIHVDNTGDLVADATVVVRFNGNQFTVSGLGATPIAGQVTPAGTAPAIAMAGAIKVFAGLRDDPFFFDLTGFKAFLAGPYTPANGLRAASQTPSDTFAGTNVSSIVLELPITALTGAANANTGTIRAWVSTARGTTQVDRMAIPAINTALIPAASKNAFNQGTPATDAATFRTMAQTTVTGLRAAVLPVLGAENGGPLGSLAPDQVAGALIPDVVTIDFAKPVAFPNGRQLTDDVIDAALGIVLNRGGAKGVGDAVHGNDRAFLGTFPYLAEPWAAAQAAPAPPKTGNAGLTTATGAMSWAVLLTLGAVVTVVGVRFAVRRSAR